MIVGIGRYLLGAALLAGLATPAAAGWYRVENYAGTIGPYPIQFSLQRYDGFGSGITAQGSYFYDRTQSPIALYGRPDGDRLRLCEILDEKEIERIVLIGSKTPVDISGCPFSLEFTADGATGSWSRGADSHPVTLRKVASLDDTGAGKVEGVMAIPFWAQTARHRFAGIYTTSATGTCMTTLQVIDRMTAKVAQEIGFDNKDICKTGTLMTSIYLNLRREVEKGVEVIYVELNDGRAGDSIGYVLNAKTDRYRLKK